MIKGWKNNPLWVKHYAEKKELEERKFLDKLKVKHELECLTRRRLQEKLFPQYGDY